VAVMALGAIEQHGPHLPLDTDTVIAEELLAAALSRLDPATEVLALPTQAVGASDEHASFPGTLSLDARSFAGVLEAVGAGVARAGIRRLVWINGHGGNRAAMDVAALALRRRYGMLVVKCTYTRLGLPDGADEHDDVARGFHGGWLETALMHRLAPERVRTDALENFSARHIDDRRDALVSPEGPAPFAWLAEDLNPAGVIGRASAATVEDGARLVDFYADRIAGVLAEAAEVELPGSGSGE
ncbi:MAG: creatininase family protein, partial [Candidatus Wenzhouxiangella sp. M2_3B_020]